VADYKGAGVDRQLHIAVEDGWYHVVDRGIERRSIFRSLADYRHFLQLLAQLPPRFGLLVQCYALMRSRVSSSIARAGQWRRGSPAIRSETERLAWRVERAATSPRPAQGRTAGRCLLIGAGTTDAIWRYCWLDVLAVMPSANWAH
jgi:hypothetical protein